MALSEKRRKSLMGYCRIDALADGEEAVLETMYDAAVNYLTEAGVAMPAEGTARRSQYDLCINFLVLCYYDQRDVLVAQNAAAENPAFRHTLNQLKLTEASNLNTAV